MTEGVFIAILGAYGGVLLLLVKNAFSTTGRLARLETILSLYGEKVAKILHSPHTPELDSLLEKYWDHHYQLSNDEWRRLQELCLAIEDDQTQAKETRTLAAFISALCSHKLMTDAPKPRRHE